MERPLAAVSMPVVRYATTQGYSIYMETEVVNRRHKILRSDAGPCRISFLDCWKMVLALEHLWRTTRETVCSSSIYGIIHLTAVKRHLNVHLDS